MRLFRIAKIYREYIALTLVSVLAFSIFDDMLQDLKLNKYLLGLPALLLVFTLIFAVAFIARYFRYKNNAISFDYDKNMRLPCFKKDNEFKCGKIIYETPQTRFGFAQGDAFIATGHVSPCTLLTGYCSSLKLGFICHFDTPASTLNTLTFLVELEFEIKKIKQEQGLGINDQYEFDCQLFGGQAIYLVPLYVRARVLSELNAHQHLLTRIKLNVIEHSIPMYAPPFAVSLNCCNGKYDGYYYDTEQKRGPNLELIAASAVPLKYPKKCRK